MSLPKRLNAGVLIGLAVVVAILALLAMLPSAFAQSKAILQSYTCPVDRIEATAEQIRTAFKNVAELRVAADRRSGQILVHAPADVQAQIAAQINQLGVQAAPAAPAPALGAVPAAPPRRRRRTLPQSRRQISPCRVSPRESSKRNCATS